MVLSVFESQVYRSAQSGATPEQIASLWGVDVESVRSALEAAEREVLENPDALSGGAGD